MITLPLHVDFKAVIAVFVGLIIQLAQLQGGVSGLQPSSTCGPSAGVASCCHGVCPCAKQRDSREKPAPLSPVSSEIKLHLSYTPAPSGVENLDLPAHDAPLRGPCGQVVIRSYAGVPLHVAFCTFVI